MLLMKNRKNCETWFDFNNLCNYSDAYYFNYILVFNYWGENYLLFALSYDKNNNNK